jgi:lipoate-protein ligase A
MAVDEALLLAADRTGAAFLRLYHWTPPALSFGRNEPALRRYDRAAIERLGLAVVRRPTGGRAVWHEHEVTYAVAAPTGAFGSLRQAYRAIHARLAAALRALGAPAELAPDGRGDARARGAPGAGPCFAAPVGGEITVGGRKVAGSAQVRHGAAFLQHGSILLDGSQDVIARVSRRPSAPCAATTLCAALGRPVSFAEVTRAIIDAWGGRFTSTVPDRPRPSPTAFSDPAWTWRR